jgi:hypothetical protein
VVFAVVVAAQDVGGDRGGELILELGYFFSLSGNSGRKKTGGDLATSI